MRDYIKACLLITIFFMPTISWGYSNEVLIWFDDTESALSMKEQYKKIVGKIIGGLPDDTCISIMTITDNSFSNHEKILNHCIPKRQFLLDPHPIEAKTIVLCEWEKRRSLITMKKKTSDIFGALYLSGILLAESKANAKLLVLVSDLRNSYKVDIENISEIAIEETMNKVRDKKLVPRLDKVMIVAVGIHTKDKTPLYFNSFQNFWKKYFDESGASLKVFSPSTDLNFHEELDNEEEIAVQEVMNSKNTCEEK